MPVRAHVSPPRPSGLDPELARVDAELVGLARKARLLGAVTPEDAPAERARLVAAFQSNRGDLEPRWRYATFDRAGVRRAAEALARDLETLEPSKLAGLYLARVHELSVEAAMVEAIGTPGFGALAEARFRSEPRLAARASLLATGWLEQPDEVEPTSLRSDGGERGSLLSRMREEVRRLDLPFKVVASDSLAALAAIGDETIWVATGRSVSPRDVERTVLHELHGHALPRARAARMPMGLFSVGTAKGGDEQEGLALVYEERGGFLAPHRRRELAARHLVVEKMLAHASFAEAVRALLAHGFPVADAVRLAERAYRGGDGKSGGLGRERVYLESFVALRAHLEAHPADEAVLTLGQVSLAAVPILRAFA